MKLLCEQNDGNFAYGEYLHALRLASKLADLRAANTHPIRARSMCEQSEVAMLERKRLAKVCSASGVRFRVIIKSKRDTNAVSLLLLVEMMGIEPVSKNHLI